MVCELLYDILGSCMIYYLLFSMWAVLLYVGCYVICGILYGMWAVV